MEYYFDHAATTPLLPQVRDRLVEAFDVYGNPSSLHRLGIAAEDAVSKARASVLKAAGVPNAKLVFTGGGTEANNLAIFGLTRRYRTPQHLVTTAVEHPSVLEAMRRLERDGWRVTYVSPRAEDGRIHAQDVLEAVCDETVLVSVMHVNNETGERLPVEEIGQGLRQLPKVRFHIDGIQAFGKLPDPAKVAGADTYALSGHKIGAPKGIGALLLLTQTALEPILYGGGQESGLRSGTENVLGIIALGEAAAAARADLPESLVHVNALSAELITGLQAIKGCVVPERTGPYSPYIVQAAFPGLKGEPIVHALESSGLYVSTGSACSSKSGHATSSHVLIAKRRPEAEIDAAIRFSLARWQTHEDIRNALEIIHDKISWLQRIMM